MALEYGVYGLTVHPRPDERHAKFSDLKPLSDLTNQFGREFNIEGYPSADFIEAVLHTRPHQCTLVPDAPDAITSNAGWDFVKNEEQLTQTTHTLKQLKIRTSLFLDPYTFNEKQLQSIQRIGCERIELYTEAFALAYGGAQQARVGQIYRDVATQLNAKGIEINAGHDLNQKNLKTFVTEVPNVLEVSIGHALIVESLLDGFKNTIQNYLEILN